MRLRDRLVGDEGHDLAIVGQSLVTRSGESGVNANDQAHQARAQNG